ncbi:MAG: hypothetical protein NVS1B6_00160 [Steroidobacteraceae bacterium]
MPVTQPDHSIPPIAGESDREFFSRLAAQRCKLQFGVPIARQMDRGSIPIDESPLFGGRRQGELDLAPEYTDPTPDKCGGCGCDVDPKLDKQEQGFTMCTLCWRPEKPKFKTNPQRRKIVAGGLSNQGGDEC